MKAKLIMAISILLAVSIVKGENSQASPRSVFRPGVGKRISRDIFIICSQSYSFF